MSAEEERLGIFGLEVLLNERGPQLPRCPQFGYFHVEIHPNTPEEGQPDSTDRPRQKIRDQLLKKLLFKMVCCDTSNPKTAAPVIWIWHFDILLLRSVSFICCSLIIITVIPLIYIFIYPGWVSHIFTPIFITEC